MDEIWQRGKVPFIVGGTGFYIDVLLGNRQTAGIAPNYALRAKLEEMSCDKLFEKLKKLDPERAEVVDKHNKRRLVRAIEIAKAETAKENPSGFWGFNPTGWGIGNFLRYFRKLAL